jgi:DNA polymerase III delta subunit
MLAPEALAERAERGQFPAAIYLEGPDEGIKAALLAELRRSWARHVPEASQARVFRFGESGIDEVMGAYHGGSLFAPRELLLAFGVEELLRSERRIAAFAEGLLRPTSGTCLVLIESAAETQRKKLDPLREACAARVLAMPPVRGALLAWGTRRMARETITLEAGALEVVVDRCEGDSIAFFDEIEKLVAWAGPGGPLRRQDIATILRPVAGADLPDYLAAVAAGDPRRAARLLGRLLAAGESEGTVLFRLSNLVGGALGGWARDRALSQALRARLAPKALTRALDALYRAEAAWKTGRADAVAVLEQATRTVAGAG